MKSFHVPLSEKTDKDLRIYAERLQVPATRLARQAIDRCLRDQLQRARNEAIASYAAEVAGTRLDLDPALESAGIEHWWRRNKVPDSNKPSLS